MQRVNVRRLPDDWTREEEALLTALDDSDGGIVRVLSRIVPFHARLADAEHTARLQALGDLDLFA